MAGTETTRHHWQAASVAIAPVVMAAALLYHPYLDVLLDVEAVGSAVSADTTRWALAHLAAGVGITVVTLAFLAVRRHLWEAGDDHHSRWALPLVLLGGGLYALLPGLEFAPLAAAQTGGDPAAALQALRPVFVPILVTGNLLFAAGLLGFIRGIAGSGILGRRATSLVVTALGVWAAARFVPLGAVQFHIQAAAGLAALWPLAYRIWRHPAASASTPRTARAEDLPGGAG